MWLSFRFGLWLRLGLRLTLGQRRVSFGVGFRVSVKIKFRVSVGVGVADMVRYVGGPGLLFEVLRYKYFTLLWMTFDMMTHKRIKLRQYASPTSLLSVCPDIVTVKLNV